MQLNRLHSLRFRIVLGSTALILLLFGLLIVNTQRVLLEYAEESVQVAAQQTSETLNLAIAPYTGAADLGVLQDYFQELVSGAEQGIVKLALFDERRHPLVATPTVPQPLPDVGGAIRQQLEQGVVHLSQPILLEGNRVGTLRFGLSTRLLQETNKRILQQSLQFLVGSLVMVVLLMIGVGVWLNRRVTRLMHASQALANGDYATRAPQDGNDELSWLAHAFNLMAKTVEERIVALENSRAEVVELNQSLEARVTERTRELAERNTELAEAIRHLHDTQESLVQAEKLAGLGAIVAAVAHELNTPIGNALTVATTFAGKTQAFQNEVELGLRRSVLQTYLEDMRTAADLIERNIQRAADLIRSFKQVSVDQTSSQRRQFDLLRMLEELATTLQPTFKKHGHQLLLDVPGGIELDSYPGPLGQVISNFIANAVLHGFEGRSGGTMRVSCTRLSNERIELVFADDGKGIAAEHLPHIFDPFFTTRLGSGGSGLGLNIAHNIVTGLLGGEISVDSAPGQGMRFRLSIPLHAPLPADNHHDTGRKTTSPDPDHQVG